MKDLQEFRSQYPQYDDMDDVTLADNIHRKFYSDLPQEQIFGKLGVSLPDSYGTVFEKAIENSVPASKAGLGGTLQAVQDTPVTGLENILNSSKEESTGLFDSYKKGLQGILGKFQFAASAIPALFSPNGKEMQEQANKELAANQPNVVKGSAKDYIGQATTSLAQNAIPLAASIFTQNPAPALGAAGIQGFGSSYVDQRNAGQSPTDAFLPALGSGAAEVVMEKLPLGILMKEGGGLFGRALKTVGAEGATEALTQLVQDGIQKGTISPNMTFEQMLSNAKDAGIVGAISGGAMGAGAHGIHRLRGTAVDIAPTGGQSDVVEQNPSAVSDFNLENELNGQPAIAEAIAPASNIVENAAPELSPTVDIDTATATLEAIKSGDLQNIHPDTVDDLVKSGELQINESGQPILTDLGEKLHNEINNQTPETSLNAQPVTQELSVPEVPNDQNRVGITPNESAPAGTIAPEKTPSVLEAATPSEEKAIADYQNAKQQEIPFSVTPKKNDVGSLVVQHNLTADNLDHADRMGGIAVPSLAISKGEHPLHNFGEITLIGDKDLVNPKTSAKNKVYGSDVYSPRYPEVQYHTNHKDVNVLNEKLRPFIEATGARELDLSNIQDSGTRELERNSAIAASFLDSNGIKPEYIKKDNGTIDKYGTESQLKKQINNNNLNDEFLSHIQDVMSSLNPDEKIFNGFTPSGKRKYLPHNLDTVVKILTKKVRGGENFNYGVGSIRAEYSKQFKTLKDIKDHEGRIVDSETFDKIKKEVDDEFFQLADKWKEYSDNKSTFGFYDNFSEHLKEAAKYGLPTINKEYYDGNVPLELQKEAAGFLNKLRDFNTEYFEAKLQRPVGIGEFKGAVVPEGARWDKAVETLKRHGVTRIERYTHQNEASRKEAVGRFSDTFFKANESSPLSDKFTQQKDQIKSKVTDIIKKINPSVDVNLVDKMFGEGAALKASGAKDTNRQEVAGAYDKLNNIVHASLNTEKWNPHDTAYHEAYHSIRDMITPTDDAILQKAFPGTDKLSQSEHEAVEFARFMTEKNATGFIPAVRRIFSAIRQALKDIGRTLKLGKFNSVDDIFNRVESGDVYAQSPHKQLVDTIKSGDINALNDLISGNDTQYKVDGNKFTEAFKKWFGDSKVVDDKGEPLTVYHGSGNDIDAFNTSGGNGKTYGTGAFFSSNPHVASTYATGSNKNVSPVHLSLKNPVVIDANGKNWSRLSLDTKIDLPETKINNSQDNDLLSQLGVDISNIKKTKVNKSKSTTFKKLFGKDMFDDEHLSTDDIVRWAKEQGYESVVIKNVIDRGPSGNFSTAESNIPADIYVAFDPTQIKSAISNNGNYDPKDPRISYKATEGVTSKQLEEAIKAVSPELHDVVYSKQPLDEEDRLNMLDVAAQASGKLEDIAYSITERVFSNAPDKEKVFKGVASLLSPVMTKGQIDTLLKNQATNLKNTRTDAKDPTKMNSGILWARNLVQSNDGSLRYVAAKYKSKVISKIADMFYHGAGHANSVGSTYFESIEDYVTRNMNKVGTALHGMNERELDQVTEILQNPTLNYPVNERVKKAALTLGKMIKDQRTYLEGAGLKLVSQIEGYFPRVYDAAKIVTDTNGFLKAAVRAYQATYEDLSSSEAMEMAEKWMDKILLQDQMGGYSSDKNDFHMLSDVPPSPDETKSRVLTKEADGIMRDYLMRNPVDVMASSIGKAARAAEFNRRFNKEDWEKMKAEMREEGVDEEAMRQVMSSIRANVGMQNNIRGAIRDVNGGLRYWSNLSFLPRSAFSSLTEGFTVATKTGNPVDGLRTMYDGFRAALETKGSQAMRDMSDMYGITGEIADDMMMAQRTGGDFTSKKQAYKNKQFFKTIGLTQITSGQLSATFKTGQFFVGKLAEHITSNHNKKKSSEFLISELGVPKDKMEEFAKWVTDNGGGKLDTEFGLGNSEMAQLYRTALRRFVQTTIQVPTAATRQRYASTPMGQFAYGLTSYINAFSKNVLIRQGRIAKEVFAKDKGYTTADRAAFAMQVSMLPVLMLLAAGVGELKDQIFQSPDAKEKTLTDHLMLGASRASVFGAFDPLVNLIGSIKYQKDPLTALDGPLPSLVSGFIKAGVNLFANNSENTNTAERNAMKQAYGLGIAPLITSVLATNNVLPGPWGLLPYAAIQAINSPQVKGLVTDVTAGEKQQP